MAEKELEVKITHATKTAAQWTTLNPVLKVGQVGHESDTHKSKTGDGSTAWKTLAYDKANTADSLATARNIGLSGVTATAQSFDGSKNITIPITAIPTNLLAEAPYVIAGITPTAVGIFDVCRADRTAFLPADQIIIEQSTDAGVTWTDAGVSDTEKRRLFTGQLPTIYIPLKGGVKSCDCMLRVTITAMKYAVPPGTPETEKYNYWGADYVMGQERYTNIEAGWIWLSSTSDYIYTKVEHATGANPSAWTTAREAYMSGWNGGNYFSESYTTFGGSTSQTTLAWNRRFTFRTCTTKKTFDDADLNPAYLTNRQAIHHIKMSGRNCYTNSNNLMYNDHLYAWDENQNATFPALVKGTRLQSTIAAGTAPLVVASNTAVTNLNADMVDGKNASDFAASGGTYDGVVSAKAAEKVKVGATAVPSHDTRRWLLTTKADGEAAETQAELQKAPASFNDLGIFETVLIKEGGTLLQDKYLGISATAANATNAGQLATARKITVGKTGKDFSGAADISFSHSEIGTFPFTQYAVYDDGRLFEIELENSNAWVKGLWDINGYYAISLLDMPVGRRTLILTLPTYVSGDSYIQKATTGLTYYGDAVDIQESYADVTLCYEFTRVGNDVFVKKYSY